MCEGCFDIFVKVGQDVKQGEVIKRIYGVVTTKGVDEPENIFSAARMEIYESDLPDVMYVENAKKIGQLTVISVLGAPVLVMIDFSQTSFKITAIEPITKLPTFAEINFISE